MRLLTSESWVRAQSWVHKVWGRKWQSTPVFLLREFHGQRSLAGLVQGVAKRHDWMTNALDCTERQDPVDSCSDCNDSGAGVLERSPGNLLSNVPSTQACAEKALTAGSPEKHKCWHSQTLLVPTTQTLPPSWIQSVNCVNATLGGWQLWELADRKTC